MKKILLGTTTLIGAASLFAGAALAETPKITVGGFVDFQAGVMSDDLDDGVAPSVGNQRNHAFRNDTEISFKVDGKADNGLGYGGQVWLEADVSADSGLAGSSDQDRQGLNASKTFIYVDGSWGRVEGGSNLGPDQTMKVDAGSIARATGGIDGDWRYFANANSIFVSSPDLPMNFGLTGGNHAGTAGWNFLGDESQENLTKLTYYTPRWSGFQLGLSYAPSDQQRGQSVSPTNRIDNTAAFAVGASDTITVSQADSVWQGGLSYEGKFDQINFAASLTGEWANAEAATYEDLRAWAVGAKVGYMGFSLAGSWADWGDSLRLNTANVDTNFWTLGGAYETGPFGVSITYLRSNVEVTTTTENEFNSWSVGADYKMAPGFTPYIEGTWFEQDAVTATNDNDGTVFIAGALLAF